VTVSYGNHFKLSLAANFNFKGGTDREDERRIVQVALEALSACASGALH
jgi:hypothetical protein